MRCRNQNKISASFYNGLETFQCLLPFDEMNITLCNFCSCKIQGSALCTFECSTYFYWECELKTDSCFFDSNFFSKVALDLDHLPHLRYQNICKFFFYKVFLAFHVISLFFYG